MAPCVINTLALLMLYAPNKECSSNSLNYWSSISMNRLRTSVLNVVGCILFSNNESYGSNPWERCLENNGFSLPYRASWHDNDKAVMSIAIISNK